MLTEIKSLEFSPKDFQVYFGEKNYIHLTLGPTETIDNFAKGPYTDVNLVINYEHCQTTYSGCSLVGLKNLERKLIFVYYGKVEKFEEQKGNIAFVTGKNTNMETTKATGWVTVNNYSTMTEERVREIVKEELAKEIYQKMFVTQSGPGILKTGGDENCSQSGDLSKFIK